MATPTAAAGTEPQGFTSPNSTQGFTPPRSATQEQIDLIARLNLSEPVRLPWQKLVLDKMFAAVALVLTSPLWLLITLAEVVGGLARREDAGPVFYHEVRVSGGRRFKLVKFRILKVAAIEEKIGRGQRPKDVENDPANVTLVGKALKKTGLDELPQFWLVLKGDMSLVGPRPKPVAEYDEEIARGIWRRRVIRAGLTGPAQLLKGTKRTEADDLLADLRYIQRFREESGWALLGHDLVLLWRTVKLMLKFTGE